MARHYPYENVTGNGSYANVQDGGQQYQYPPQNYAQGMSYGYNGNGQYGQYGQQQQYYTNQMSYDNSPFADSNNINNTSSFDDGPVSKAPAAGAASGQQQPYSPFDAGVDSKQNQARSCWRMKRTWVVLILVLLVVAGAGGGIAAWQLTKDKTSSSSSSSKGIGSNSDSNGGSGTTVSGDPSDFKLDTRLKQSFYGLAYSPTGAILPNCGATLPAVQRDMQLLSQLTTRIRTYGSDCNASALVMQAIQDTKVDITVWLGIYIDTDDTIWERQRNDTLAIIQQYGTDHISGITVGNEFLLNTEGAASSYTSIRRKIAEFKKDLDGLNLSKTIPVGTADAGSMITSALAASADYIMANVHPWFGGVPIDMAAGWTWEWQQENVISKTGTTPAYIAETGWPSESMTAANATLGGAVAGIPELQEFLDTYVCQANTNQSTYFYFEPFDEPWKEVYGGVEPYWGLFDKDRNLKDITIPDCKPGNY